MNVVFLGPPGAGKGTQAKKASAVLGIRHLSTGDILRAAIRAESELGREIKAVVESGRLVSDELIGRLVEVELRSESCRGGYLLDGYPRNLEQAVTLGQIVNRLERPLDCVLVLAVPDDVLRGRLLSRRSCPGKNCGAMYHLTANPPKVSGICDICGADLITRADDQDHVVNRRLAVYQRETLPLIAHYEKLGLIRSVDGSDPIESVEAAILVALKAGLV